MKFYKMIIEPIRALPGDGEKERKSYTSPKAGAAPCGYRCVAVVGYFEKPSKNERKSNHEED